LQSYLSVPALNDPASAFLSNNFAEPAIDGLIRYSPLLFDEQKASN
jgi:hypothetical protein